MGTDVLWFVGIVATAAEVVGVATAFHAIMHARTAQGATAWVVSLVTMPVLSLPLYWIFGRSKFQGYVKARQSGNERIDRYLEKFKNDFGAAVPFDEKDRTYARVVERLGRLPFAGFNRTALHVDGEAAFGAMFEGIEKAEEYLLIQFFIVKDDGLGRELRDRLVARAKKGVRVYFLYDEIGSHKLSRSYLRSLEEAGVSVSSFKTTKGRRNRFQVNFRNHRKIVAADGRIAWIGGLNVGDEYMGRNPKFGRWRDTLVEIEGPAAQQAQVSFFEDCTGRRGRFPSSGGRPSRRRRANGRFSSSRRGRRTVSRPAASSSWSRSTGPGSGSGSPAPTSFPTHRS